MGQLPLKFEGLKEIAELSDDGVFIYDVTNQKISYSNALAFELFGIEEGASKQELLSLYEELVPEDREYIAGYYLEAVKKTSTQQSEFRLTDKNGQPVVVCCTTYLLDSNVVVFVRDITKPKTYEDYLVEFGSRKNTVLDVLVHQLSGALYLTRNLSAEASKYLNEPVDKNLKAFFELLNSNNSQCLNVINDLMRNEHELSPKISVKATRIDIVSKITLVYDEFRQSYRHRIFEFRHALKSFYINTDEIKVLQIINNLVSNAIKFSTNAQPISIAITEDASDIIISVKDEGIGIPDSLREFIFDRQSVASRTGLNGERATGYGLSICKRLAELVEGKISFETVVDKGSTFYLSLPKK